MSEDTQDPANSTRATAIYTKLRGEILCGTLPAGTKINIRTLCERFDVGFSPVREALNRLLNQNLLQQTDRRGFTVTPVSVEELEDITRARCLINEAALRASISDGNAEWEERILLNFHRLLRTPRDDGGPGPSLWTVAHKRFHSSLLAACGSTWVLTYCDQLFEATERYRLLAISAGGQRGDADEEHRAIMQATIDRKADEAVQLLTRHFQKTQEQMRDLINVQGQNPAAC
jgi:GntR family carbon starvation induced transcriptional regulator